MLSNMSTTKLTSAARILTIYFKSERRYIEDINATCIDDIKYDQTNAHSMKYDHLLAIAQIRIESNDIKDEDKYIDSINILSASYMNDDHSFASATF